MPARKYQALVFIPSVTGAATVTYTICSSGGCATRQVNQAAYSNSRVSLSTYAFAGTTADYVSVSNVTTACCTQSIALDEVEFVPRSQ